MTGQSRAYPSVKVRARRTAWASGFTVAVLGALANLMLAPRLPTWSLLTIMLGVFISWALVRYRTDAR